MIGGSVRTRLTLWSIGVQAVALAAMGAVLWFAVRANMLSLVDHDLADRTHAVARRFGAPRRMGERRRRSASTPPSVHLTRVLNLQGGQFFPDAPPESPWDPHGFAIAASGREVFTTIRVADEPMRVSSVPLRPNGVVVGVVQHAESLKEIDRDMLGLTRALLTLIPLALLVTGLSGAFLTDRLLRPVREITVAAGRIGAADLSERLPVGAEDEFARLTCTLNAMLERLESAFERQQRFTADASHELRTPLTAIKAHTSLALSGEKTPDQYRRALVGANRAATMMSQIVEDLLLLARLDAGKLRPECGPARLQEVVEAASEMLEGYEHAAITIGQETACVEGLWDADQLVRLFTNLLDNAARHTPTDGRIEVHSVLEGAHVHVRVTDTGVGIAPEHIPHVCERFYRVDSARSRKHGGTGLGLAISQSIVAAHHGALRIESVEGHGTTVHVILSLTGPAEDAPRDAADAE